jgi:hypothetical protein
LSALPIQAVTIETVPVGEVSNLNNPATGKLYGGVGYAYNIGKYEVTIGPYTAFLNAGSWAGGSMHASSSEGRDPSVDSGNFGVIGFRAASAAIPEPGSATLIFIAVLLLMLRRTVPTGGPPVMRRG